MLPEVQNSVTQPGLFAQLLVFAGEERYLLAKRVEEVDVGHSQLKIA